VKKIRIGVFTPPIEKAGLIPFSNLIDVLSSVSDDISIISGNVEIPLREKNNVSHYKFYSHTPGKSHFSRILTFIFLQMKISFYIIKFYKYADFWLFFLGGEVYIIPLMMTRFLKRPVYCVLTSSASQLLFFDRFHFFMRYSAKISYFFADKIIINAPRLISEWHLESFRPKIIIAPCYFKQTDFFSITTSFSHRPFLIGYIGRLSEEKGVQHFVQALPDILRDRNDFRAFIGGDGPLKGSVVAALQEETLTTQVDLSGWISHDDLPHYLNQLRLLVIPSYTEACPIIMLEAMACGTPVLATPVGMIPDILRDGETGFIMRDNSPDCIRENVTRALSSPNLEKIADNGREFVEKNFTFKKTVGKWEKLINDL